MPFIALLGCDGSGKSAVISRISEHFRSDGVAVVLGHWRPVAFSGKEDGHPNDDPHGKPPHGFCKSTLKLGWLWLNWWTGWCKSLSHASKHGIVLFDRFHGDLLVDPRRYRYGGSMCLAKIACRLMPQPDLILFLDAEPDILLSRKQEVTRGALAKSREKYLTLGKSNPRFTTIDVSRPLDSVVEDVASKIRNLR